MELFPVRDVRLITVELTQDVELEWNDQVVKTSQHSVNDGEVIVWHAKAIDGGIYRLREEEPLDPELDIFIPAMLMKPASPTAGQTWNYTSKGGFIARNFTVTATDGPSPNGITGCVVVEEVRPRSYTDTWYFKGDTAVALTEKEYNEAGISVIYRVGD